MSLSEQDELLLQNCMKQTKEAAETLAGKRREILSRPGLDNVGRNRELALARQEYRTVTGKVQKELDQITEGWSDDAKSSRKLHRAEVKAELDGALAELEQELSSSKQPLNTVLDLIVSGSFHTKQVIASQGGEKLIRAALTKSGETPKAVDTYLGKILKAAGGQVSREYERNGADGDKQDRAYFKTVLPRLIEELDQTAMSGTGVVVIPSRPGSDEKPVTIDFSTRE